MNLQLPLLSAGKQHPTVNRSIASRLFSSTIFYSCCLLMTFLFSVGFTYYKKWWASTYVNTSTASFPSTPFTGRVITADFDKDGDEDILYQNGADGTPVLFAASNGNGTFAAAVPQSASPFRNVPAFNIITNSTYVKDFDGDGDKDLWIGIANTTGTYLRNDNGVFSSQSSATFPAPQFPGRPVAGDFDGDGDADILYQTGADGSPFMYARNNGNASFTIVAQSASPFPAVILVNMNAGNSIVADFNHDGRQDIWVPAGNATGNYYQNNSGGFSEPSSAGFPAPQFPGRVKVADYDNDDDPDILYQTGVDGSPFGYYQNNGNGTFTNTGIAGSPLNGLTLPNVLGTTYNIVEFDNDGDIDIYVTANGTQGTYFVQQIPQNAGPWIHFESGAHDVNVNEDQPKTITRISFSDADAGSASVTVSFAAPSGTWTATAGNGVTVFGSGSDSIALNGSIAAINAFIANQQVSYQTALNNSTDLLALVYINDNGHTGQGGPKIARSAISMNVQPVNDAPVNTVPGPQQTNINTDLTFNAGNANLISISDPDVVNPAVTQLQVTLTVTNGLISLGSTSGLVFSGGDGVLDATMTFKGSLNDLNAALNNITFVPTNGYTGAASLQITTSDLGNTGSGGIQTDPDNIPITINSTNPLVTTVQSTNPNGTYKMGDQINVTITFNQPVVVNTAGGTPSLLLETGTADRIAGYISGSGSSTLTFRYTVLPGDATADLDYTSTTALAVNGGSIRNTSNIDAILTLPAVGGANSLGGQRNISIDGITPMITSVNVPGNDTYTASQLLDFTVNYTEVVDVNTSGGTPYLNITVGSTPRQAAYINGSGTNALTFRYTVQPGDLDPDGITLSANLQTNGGTIKDLAGNYAGNILQNLGNTQGVLVDAVAPTVAISTTAANPVNGAFTITITFSEAMTGFTAGDITGSNCTFSAFTAINPQTYTVLVTPAADGPLSINIAAGVAQDLASNTNAASNTLARTFDGTAPAIVISSTAPNTVSGAFTATFTFNEPVNGFIGSDITVVNGITVSNFMMIDAQTYTALITPFSDGPVSVYVQANRATDDAGNGNTVSNILIRIYDGTVPSVVISTTAVSPVNQPFTIQLVFSEAVTGLTAGDLTIVNGTASNLQTTDNKNYSALITPTSNGQVTVQLPAATVVDGVGNANSISNLLTISNDIIAPAVTLSKTIGAVTNVPFTINIQFSEVVNGFVVTDLTLTNATASNLQTTDNKNYTALITPGVDGTVTVTVPAGIATDQATNPNAASAALSVLYDHTKPTVVITTAAPDPVIGPFTITITFSEAVNGFTASDLAVGNATVSNFVMVDPQTYTVLITPVSDGNVSISVAANKATDPADNSNTASNTLSRTYDGTAPSVVISTTAVSPVNQPFTIQLVFSEPVTGLTTGDLTIGNGTASNLQTTDNKNYSVLITPTADGQVTVQLPAATVMDGAGNANTASNQLTISNDMTAPVVTLSKTVGAATNAPFTINIHFSEVVNGFVLTDLALTNATVSNLQTTDNKNYTALITPAGEGTVTVTVPAGIATDQATNPNTASVALSVLYDITKPAVAITTAAPDPVKAPFTITITFSEAVNGFDANDLTVLNGSISNLQTNNNITFTATVQPAKEGVVSVTVKPAGAVDRAGNTNTASATLSRHFDISAPVITVSARKVALNFVTAPFTVQFKSAEKIRGLTLAGIAVTNGVASNLVQENDFVYRATITPVYAREQVTVQLPAGSVEDLAGNPNALSNKLSLMVFGSARIVKLYPVPTRGPLTILFEGILEKKTRIMVMDFAGRIFYTRDYQMTSKQLQLDFSGLMPVGAYQLVVINDGYIERRNIVIAP